MSEMPHMPTHDEIIKEAIKKFMLANPDAPTPTESELKEGSWFDAARRELMSGVKSQLEEYLAYLEAEAESIQDELGIKPAPPSKEVSELEEQVDILSVKLDEARRKMRNAREEVEKLKAVKVPPKVVKPPPKEPEGPVCPTHKVELIDVAAIQPVTGWEFPWGRVFVPSEMFLYQCPQEFEYYICEPRKRCEFIRLDTLRRRLAAIVKPIAPKMPRPPRAAAPRYPYVPPIVEAAEREAAFETYLKEVGITKAEYNRLDTIGKFVMRQEYRRWKSGVKS
jgi:hypothetical protein